MSAKIMGLVWDYDLPYNKQIVLLSLADHADHDGNNIFPSIPLTAWKTGYSQRQVQRIIRLLEKDGALVHYGETQSGTIIYKIILSVYPLKKPLDHQHKWVSPVPPPGDNMTPPPGDKMSPPGDSEMPPNPSVNKKGSDVDVVEARELAIESKGEQKSVREAGEEALKFWNVTNPTRNKILEYLASRPDMVEIINFVFEQAEYIAVQQQLHHHHKGQIENATAVSISRLLNYDLNEPVITEPNRSPATQGHS